MPQQFRDKMTAIGVCLGGFALVQAVVFIALAADPDRATTGDITAIETVAHADAPDAPQPAGPTPDEVFTDRVRPLLEDYCFRCHGAERQKGDVDLEPALTTKDIRRHRKDFHRAWEMLATGEMPPEGKDQPTDEERALMVSFIETELNRLDCDGPRDPGRVVLRRLSRYEYANTIRDLLGVEFQPGPEFPMDDVGYGFDNIGDVMSLPPLLMEKYLAAADDVLDAAIVAEREPEPWSQKVMAVDMKDATGGNDPRDGFRWFHSNGRAQTELAFPTKGKYLIEIIAAGETAGGAPPRLAVQIDGKDVQAFDVDAPRDKPTRYAFKAELDKGNHTIAVAFTNDYYNPDAKNRRDRDRNLMVVHLQVAGPVDLPAKPITDSHRRIFTTMPGGSVGPRDAAGQILADFIPRAFRRPLRAGETDRFLSLYDLAVENGEDFENAVQLTLTGVLASPHFLFRVETDRDPRNPADAGDSPIVPVGDYALATRLSYFLWSSMPDQELFDLAAKGQLGQPDVLHKQVRRMLADPKARRFAENFAEQWLQIRILDDVAPDPKVFPEFNDQLRAAMREEVVAFFEHVVRADRPLTDLLDARYTFVNERLAKHYGIDGVTGDEFQRVELTDPARGGVMAMAAPLTVTSHARRTSLVKRGKWVLEVILGTPPPPPAPEAGELDDTVPIDQNLSTRERLEQHRADPTCAVCHRRIDPLGFGFEVFDPIGRIRATDDGQPIDATGQLITGQTFDGPAELKQVLMADKDAFVRALSEKMLIYAIGRGLEHYDACAVKEISDAVRDDEYRFSSLVIAITESLPFRHRRSAAMQNAELTELAGD